MKEKGTHAYTCDAEIDKKEASGETLIKRLFRSIDGQQDEEDVRELQRDRTGRKL